MSEMGIAWRVAFPIGLPTVIALPHQRPAAALQARRVAGLDHHGRARTRKGNPAADRRGRCGPAIRPRDRTHGAQVQRHD